MRILHVISPAPLPPQRFGGLARSDEFATPDAAIALLAELTRHPAGFEHSTLVLGHARSVERARSLGIAVTAACAPPLGIPSLALGKLRRILSDINPVATFEWEGGRVNASPLESLHSSPTFHINALSGTLRSMQQASSIATLTPPMEPLVRTMPREASETELPAAARLREQAGIDQRTRLVALLGDHPHVACVTTFATVIGMLHVGGFDVAGVFAPSAHQSDRAVRASTGSGYTPRMIQAEESLLDWLGACDAAVLCPPGEHVLPGAGEEAFAMHLEIAFARGAGLAAVTPAKGTLARLADTSGQVLMAEQGRAALIAGRLREALLAPRPGTDQFAAATPSGNSKVLSSASVALHKAVATIPYLHEPLAIETALFGSAVFAGHRTPAQDQHAPAPGSPRNSS